MAKKTKKNQKRKSQRQKQGKRIIPPKAFEIRQRKRLLSIVTRITRLINRKLIPKIRALEPEFVADSRASARKELIAILNLLNQQTMPSNKKALSWSESFVGSVDRDNERRNFNMFKKTTGIDLKRVIMNEGISEELKKDIKMNVGLIRSISDVYFERLNKIFEKALFEGKGDAGSLIDQITALGESTRKRAKFIARDQTATITGKLNERRSENLGSPGYRWRNSQDRRVRGNPSGKYPNSQFDHWEREGRFYLWPRNAGKRIKAPNGKPFRQPPLDGPPGVPIACRCTAIPVIPLD